MPSSVTHTSPQSASPRCWLAIALLALGIVALLFWRNREPARAVTTPVPEKSIAVLPFEKLSRDPENAYFAEGIQDEILTRLAKFADLKVISRTSTRRITKARRTNLQEDRAGSLACPHP